MSYCKKLHSQKIITNVKPYIFENIQYETVMGSQAYGVSGESSDIDIYAFTIPPKHVVFPHTAGYIYGFGRGDDIEVFNQYQQHHIKSQDKEIDVTVYNIVKYFTLLLENNPNIIDSLFTRQQSVTFSSTIGDMVRENRTLFLHKGAWHKFRGYAYSQLSKIKNKKYENSKRKETVELYGYDVKHAYHVVRLINEVEDILTHGDFDIMKNNDMLKSIRAGEWSFEKIQEYFDQKEKILDSLYHASSLRKTPDTKAIKRLLIDCLEEFYGTLGNDELNHADKFERAINDIRAIVGKL